MFAYTIHVCTVRKIKTQIWFAENPSAHDSDILYKFFCRFVITFYCDIYGKCIKLDFDNMLTSEFSLNSDPTRTMEGRISTEYTKGRRWKNNHLAVPVMESIYVIVLNELESDWLIGSILKARTTPTQSWLSTYVLCCVPARVSLD